MKRTRGGLAWKTTEKFYEKSYGPQNFKSLDFWEMFNNSILSIKEIENAINSK